MSQAGFELDFERPLTQLERQIAELRQQAEKSTNTGVDFSTEIAQLRANHGAMLRKIYDNLSPANVVKVARHPARPQAMDHLRMFVKDFCELHGDRRCGDDRAIITGFGRVGPHKVLIVAHHKGKDTRERLATHWGMAHPEGYRKALLKMKLAEKYGLPVVTLVDTAGAFPGIEAEERGQGQAIAENLMEMARLRVPVISAIIGEGGSGGALGIGVADRVAMMQYAWYSVISPEGCAAILWKTADEESRTKAAEALKLTAAANLSIRTIDDILAEPMGGAHRDPAAASATLEKWIADTLRDLKRLTLDALLARRYEKLRRREQVLVRDVAK